MPVVRRLQSQYLYFMVIAKLAGVELGIAIDA
jgi:hypothetical protein